jgi:hypothetical protein
MTGPASLDVRRQRRAREERAEWTLKTLRGFMEGVEQAAVKNSLHTARGCARIHSAVVALIEYVETAEEAINAQRAGLRLDRMARMQARRAK